MSPMFNFFVCAIGAQAIVGALLGDFSPAGRTAVTWYESTAQLPPRGHMSFYKSKESNGITYRYFEGGNVIFPFGHGLSYTTFRYSDLSFVRTSVRACDSLEVIFDTTKHIKQMTHLLCATLFV
jgi:beta-glucosidase